MSRLLTYLLTFIIIIDILKWPKQLKLLQGPHDSLFRRRSWLPISAASTEGINTSLGRPPAWLNTNYCARVQRAFCEGFRITYTGRCCGGTREGGVRGRSSVMEVGVTAGQLVSGPSQREALAGRVVTSTAEVTDRLPSRDSSNHSSHDLVDFTVCSGVKRHGE